MWFSALKLGLNAASHIYKKRQETKMAMADAGGEMQVINYFIQGI